MPVVLDPDAAAVYRAFQEAGRPAYETLTAPEAREYYLAARFVSNPEPPALESVDVLDPAPHGAIPARLYSPKKRRETAGLAPCLVFFHGGGWVIGNLDSHDVVCRQLAHEGELIVISVDYRLRPSTSFPPRSTTPSPRPNGSPPMRENLASMPRASPSAATAPAATSPRWSQSPPAMAMGPPSPVRC
jgi:alpha/beta hydrolase fold